MAHPVGHRFYIGFYKEKHEKFFLFETTRSRALKFAMNYHLVDFYQVLLNYTPGAKTAPSGGHMLYIGSYREKYKKIFLSTDTTRPRAMVFGMKHYLVVFYTVRSNYTPGPKWHPPWGSHA